MRDTLYLIDHGWPPDVAFSMDATKRTAFCIIHKEHELKAIYNFNTQKFE